MNEKQFLQHQTLIGKERAGGEGWEENREGGIAQGMLVLGYYGGKAQMVQELLPLLCEHKIYVEPFGGSAVLLLNKWQSPLEVYNDINQYVVNLFRVLRDPQKSERLIIRLWATPYSREEYHYAKTHYKDKQLDEVERAALFFTALYQSINFTINGGWSRSLVAGDLRHRAISAWLNRIERLLPIAERLRHVVVENDDFERVIRDYDSSDTLFYIDPPYVHSTRVAPKVYEHEMSDDDHVRLLRLVQSVSGKVIISGYANPLYDTALAGWYKRDIHVKCRASVVRGGGELPNRVESVWMNYTPSVQQQLSL